MDIKKIREDLGQSWNDFQLMYNQSLKASFPLMNQVNNYLLQRSGKQIRPMLGLLTASAIGAINTNTIKCVTASELIHTATLLHDDVADDASMRRGVPTVRSLFSPSASVLAGDFWLSRAVKILLEIDNTQVFSCFVKTIEDLAEGELLQMSKASSLDTTFDDYIDIISRKTASLFESTIKSVAISVGASQQQLCAMAQYAHHLGIAFQMRDDIFDYSSDMQTGKMPAVDIVEKKFTIPLLCAFKQSTTQEIASVKELFEQIGSDAREDSKIIEQIVKFVKRKNGIELAQDVLVEQGNIACLSLSQFSDSIAKSHLISLAEYVCNRLR